VGNVIMNFGSIVLTPPGASALFPQVYSNANPYVVTGDASLVGPTGGGAGPLLNVIANKTLLSINCTGASGTLNWLAIGS
jgi:hypothetical protein